MPRIRGGIQSPLRGIRLLVACGLTLTFGCGSGKLARINNNLVFSCPAEPTAVTQPDASDVVVDFGQVGLGTSRTLTLKIVSNGAPILLGALTAVQANDEFGLTLMPGTSVGSDGIQSAVTFAPTSLGAKTAIETLVTDASGAGLVRLTLTGQGFPRP